MKRLTFSHVLFLSALIPALIHAQSEKVIERLNSFASLDAREWQYHEGAVEHGEDLALDPAGWKTVRLPMYAPKDEVWLRRWVEIPKTLNGYDLTGARITFKIDVGGYGPGRGYLYEMIYVNGQRVVEGTFIPRRTILESAKPGDRILLAVRMPETLEVKHFEGAFLEVNVAPSRPNPVTVATELASAAQLLPEKKGVVEDAAHRVNFAALDRGDQASFDASLIQAQRALEPLRPLLQKYLVQLTGNAHIDAAWLWTASEGVDQVHFTFANVLELMREYPQYRFAQSSAQYYEWMEQKFPALFADVQKRVKEGRWELVGGMWVEPDLNVPGGESQVRQLLLGKRYFQQKFGVDVKIGWNVDSFGYNWQLPQIYKKSGIDSFITQKLRYNDTNQLPLKLFWWQSPDGSRVLAYFPHDIVQGTEAMETARDLVVARKLNPGQDELLHVYGPSLGRMLIPGAREALDNGSYWAEPGRVFPRVAFRTTQSFFDDMASRVETAHAPVWNYKTLAKGDITLPAPPAGKISLPVWNDEIYLEHHRGTYTTHADEKENLRRSEEGLLDAEKFSSLAWLAGRAYPGAALTDAWKTKALYEFHDVGAGTAIEPVYKDAQRDFDAMRRMTNEATEGAQREMARHVNTAAQAGVPVMVWNSLSWDRAGVVTASVQMPGPTQGGIHVVDAEGNPVRMQVLSHDPATNTWRVLLQPKHVPSVGYTVLHVVAGERAVESDLALHDLTMENEKIRVTLDAKTGCISSLYQKAEKFESIAAGKCGNGLEAFVDTGRSLTEANLDSIKVEDAWNIDKTYDTQKTALTMVSKIEVIERGPVREVVRVTRQWSKSTFVQDITLYAGSPQVEVVNDIDWHETHVMLKTSMPLAASGPTATYEIPYGSIERPTTRDNVVDAARFEVPAQRWADLGDGAHGLSLINDSKYGYDALGNVLRLTLLRSPTYPDATADRGRHHFRYALYPHTGTWKQAETVLRAYEFNQPMQAVQVESHVGAQPPQRSLVRVGPGNVVLSAMKKSEEGDGLILRFYEWAGEKSQAEITVPVGAAKAAETDLMERAVRALPLKGDRLRVEVLPYSINTVRVSYREGAR